MLIRSKIRTLDDLPSRKGLGCIGICTGCYDVLQSGHAVFFEQCKEYCDTLLVVVGRATVIAKQKPGRPINSDNNRMFLVAAIQAVDYVFLGDNHLLPGKIDCFSLCKSFPPDVYILNDDDSGIREKKAFCEEHGIAIKLVPRAVPDFLEATSTTAIIAKIRAS